MPFAAPTFQRRAGLKPAADGQPQVHSIRQMLAAGKPPPRQLSTQYKRWTPTNPPSENFDPEENGYMPFCFYDNEIVPADLEGKNAFGRKMLLQGATVHPPTCEACGWLPLCANPHQGPVDIAVGSGPAHWNAPVHLAGEWKVDPRCCSPCSSSLPGMSSGAVTAFAFTDPKTRSVLTIEYPEPTSCSCSCIRPCHAVEEPLYIVKKDGHIVAMAQGIAKGLIQPRDCGAVCRDCCVSEETIATITDGKAQQLFYLKNKKRSCCDGKRQPCFPGCCDGCIPCGCPVSRSWFEPMRVAGNVLHAARGPKKGQVVAKFSTRYALKRQTLSCSEEWQNCLCTCCPGCWVDLHKGDTLPSMPLYHCEVEMPNNFGMDYSPEAWQALLGWLLMVELPQVASHDLPIGNSVFKELRKKVFQDPLMMENLFK